MTCKLPDGQEHSAGQLAVSNRATAMVILLGNVTLVCTTTLFDLVTNSCVDLQKTKARVVLKVLQGCSYTSRQLQTLEVSRSWWPTSRLPRPLRHVATCWQSCWTRLLTASLRCPVTACSATPLPALTAPFKLLHLTQRCLRDCRLVVCK